MHELILLPGCSRGAGASQTYPESRGGTFCRRLAHSSVCVSVCVVRFTAVFYQEESLKLGQVLKGVSVKTSHCTDYQYVSCLGLDSDISDFFFNNFGSNLSPVRLYYHVSVLLWCLFIKSREAFGSDFTSNLCPG